MKVLLVNKLYPPDSAGGAEAITQALAESHRRHGLDVTVATTGDSDTTQRDHVGDIPVVRIPLSNFFWHHEIARRGAFARAAWHVRDASNRLMARALEQVIRKLNPDVVAFHNLCGFSASAWRAAQVTGKPSLQVLHDYYHLCPRSHLFAKGQRCERRCADCTLFRLGRRRQSNKVQAVVGVSQAVLDAHLSRGLFGAASVRQVIHNAITPALRERRVTTSAARVFGYIGTLSDWKGVQPMLDAFQGLLSSSPELRLRVAGSGDPSFVAALRERCADPRVEFLGRVCAPDFFRTIDALIVPSQWDDPLPTVIIESLSAGIPVVGARRGGIPELIDDRRNGLIYEPSRPGELERCLDVLAREPALMQRLRAGCERCAFTDQDRMARAHERVYEGLAAGRSA